VRIAVIPGDGIGKEVTAEAVKAIEAAAAVTGEKLELQTLPWSADHYLSTGVSMPPNGYAMLRDDFDAALLGALGDPRVPDHRHIRDILLGIRFELDLYVNYRPVRLLHERLCPLKDRSKSDVNFVVFRENTEGAYVGVGGRFKAGTPDEIAVQEEINTFKGVNRIIRHAFEYAVARGLKKVCMADKSNAMVHGHALWLRVFREVAVEYPQIEATQMYVDALAMFLVKDPGMFQVIVTNNMFGDIVTDIGGALQGGLGMAASGNIHPGRTSLFEPVHGSAPPLAGKNVANPMGAILSAALLLETIGKTDAAGLIEQAVEAAVLAEQTTPDIGGKLGTREVGDWVASKVRGKG
jgi:3-isopropylmalate dehydrogenase